MKRPASEERAALLEVAGGSAAPRPSPVELLTARRDAKARRVADIQERSNAAAEARSRAEAELESKTLAREEAMRASAAERGSDALAMAAASAEVRRQHAATDLAEAVRAHEALKGELAGAEAWLAQAELELARARKYEELWSDNVHDAAARMSGDLLEHTFAVMHTLRAYRERVERHNRLLAEWHALGGDLSLRPIDGTPAAGAFARYLHRAGGTCHVSNPHEVRFIFDPPQNADDPNNNVFDVARRTIDFALRSLEWAERNGRNGVPERGRLELEDVARIFTDSRTRAETIERLDELQRQRGHVREEKDRRAHEKRLATKVAEEMTERRRRPRAGDYVAPEQAPPAPVVELIEPVDFDDLTVG